MPISATSRKQPVSLRLSPEMVAQVDAYAQSSGISRTDAFSFFVERGLASLRQSSDQALLQSINQRVMHILSLLQTTTPNDRTRDLELQAVKNAVAAAARRFSSIERAYLFGSFARKTFSPESDVDVRLELRKDSPFNLRDLEHFCKSVEQATGRHVDALSARVIKNSQLQAAIEKEKVLVYERQEG